LEAAVSTATQLEPLASVSLQEVVDRKLIPLSKTSLYRWAESGESPFSKIQGKWMTTPALLLKAVEEGPKPKSPSIGNPMPRVRGHRSSFAAKLANLEGGN
jgi:hypothetical protein